MQLKSRRLKMGMAAAAMIIGFQNCGGQPTQFQQLPSEGGGVRAPASVVDVGSGNGSSGSGNSNDDVGGDEGFPQNLTTTRSVCPALVPARAEVPPSNDRAIYMFLSRSRQTLAICIYYGTANPRNFQFSQEGVSHTRVSETLVPSVARVWRCDNGDLEGSDNGEAFVSWDWPCAYSD